MVPCNYIHAELGPTNDTVHESCIPDRQQQMDYLGNMQMVVYTDEEAFRLKDFEQEIERRSRFFTKQVDNSKPVWFDGTYTLNLVEDETSYFQYG